MNSLIWPEYELVTDFMSVLVTVLASLKRIWSKLKVLSSGQHFLLYKSMGKFFVTQERVTPTWMVWSGPKSNSSEILWLSWLPASMTKIRSKMKSRSPRQLFPHYKSFGAFGCHRNQSFYPVHPKSLCSLSPTQMMLHIKFDQDWPTGLRDIQV